jgi:hypothetical protein
MIKRERIERIRLEITPSHQSDLLDTLMCKFELLPGKEDIIHGDYYYAGYHSDYKKNKPLTRMKSFDIDIVHFFEKGGLVQSMENKVLFTFPYDIINKGNAKKSECGLFPMYVCEFKEEEDGIAVKCYPDYENQHKDFKKYKRNFPNLIEYL